MEKCKECGILYPGHIVYARLCGICSLEIANNVFGLNQTSYKNKIAELFRQEAIKHREELKILDSR